MKKLLFLLSLLINVVSFAQTEDIQTLKQKANNNFADAQYSLGSLYYKGKGVKQSYTQAAYWWRKACENLDDSACEKLNNLKKRK